MTRQTEPLHAIGQLVAKPSEQLLALYIEAAEAGTADGLPADAGREGSEQALAIFGVLCHRTDETAQAFVAEQRAKLAGRDDRGGTGAGRKAMSLNDRLAQIRQKGGAALRMSASGRSLIGDGHA